MDNRIKAAYLRLKYLLSEIPLSGKSPTLDQSIVDSFHNVVEELASTTGENFDRFKANQRNAHGGYGAHGEIVRWDTDPIRIQVGSLIGHLEGMYGLNENNFESTPSIPHITLINQTTMAVTMTQSVSQLITKAESEDEKCQLERLKDELESPEPNWETIKVILVWAVNFSKDLFLQLIPIILKHFGLS